MYGFQLFFVQAPVSLLAIGMLTQYVGAHRRCCISLQVFFAGDQLIVLVLSVNNEAQRRTKSLPAR